MSDYGDCLAIPPMDNIYLSEQALNDDVYLNDHGFDFSIDDLLNDSELDPFDPTRFSTNPEFLNSEQSPSGGLNNSPSIFQSSCDVDVFVDCGSQESNGSNKGSNVLESGSNKSVTSSPDFGNDLIKNGVVDQSIDIDGYFKNEGGFNSKKIGLLKRKLDSEDCSNSYSDLDTNFNKHRKAGDVSSGDGGDNVDIRLEEDEKKKARLVRNRESAQLSRQRKKHYVEELEDKVRTMHCTIQDLNAKISYVIAENASLKQQIGGGGVVPSTMAPPPGVYPHPPMMYPWMHAPPYMMKAQGSQVPLVPIPRLKSRQVASAPKASRKADNKKSEGRTKKVASVSFLGLLFFMLLFGGLVPTVNVRYGGMKDPFMDRSDLVGNGQYDKHHGRVLTVNGSGYGEKFSKAPDISSKLNCAPRDHLGGEPSAKCGGYESVRAGNGSEPLMASLYVPRNDKLVKIDGNLIIHSILASEKATTPSEDQQEKKNDETGLAVPGDLVPSDPRRNAGRRHHLALGSGVESEKLKARAADSQLHQWFREGLAGPLLSSGRCTEVFQFDVVSAPSPGSITSARNVSTESSKNSAHVSKGRNRRILQGLPTPLPGSSAHNASEEGTRREAGNGSFPGTNSPSSMVVSVLLDPIEAGDAEGDGVMGPKSLSKIFVVVLIDGVKYVTYSCMFPFKGAAVPHLVTA